MCSHRLCIKVLTYGVRECADDTACEETNDAEELQLQFPCLRASSLQDMANSNAKVRSRTGQMRSSKGIVAVSTSETVLHAAGQGTAPDEVRRTRKQRKKKEQNRDFQVSINSNKSQLPHIKGLLTLCSSPPKSRPLLALGKSR